MIEPIIRMSSVSKRFGSKPVLDQLDWQIMPGQVIGLLGRNGAGKSTLMECLLGLRETDHGSIAIFGEATGDLSEAARARIGYVPQSAELFEWMTPAQLLAYFKALYPRWNDEKVEALLQRWGFNTLMRERAIGKLSGGEKQRLSIIRALGHEPDLLVLDEPVSALDPVGRRDFLRELVDGVIERGTTVLFSTPVLSNARKVDAGQEKRKAAAIHEERRVTLEQCFKGVCFIRLDASGQKFFGFSECLAGLALMVLAWTIADVRYRFRVRTAPIPLLGITYSVVAAVGVLTLLTDLWRAEQWLVPKGNLLTPGSWQAMLGGVFLLTFLTWAWFAFIRPPTYGRHNAKRFAQTLYRFILKGSSEELAVIADELGFSARALVRHATDRGRLKNYGLEREDEKKRPPRKAERYANDLLLLIADRRLCRAIVYSSPGTALALFQAMADTKKHGIQVETFAKNIVNEALANKDSFLYHEAEGYQSGLIGYHKPLSQAMFSDYQMVETIGTLLDPDIFVQREWDAGQWQAYCRIVLMAFRSYVEEGYKGHSYVLYRAKTNIEHAVSDLYTLNGATNSAWDDDLQARLRTIVEFIKDAVEILEKKGGPDHIQLRIRDKSNPARLTFHDHLANSIFEIMFAASAVTAPDRLCWWIQHNSVWSKLFNFDRLKGRAGAAVKFKVRRLLYDEIADMKRFPNFKGARILGFCINVMGLTLRPRDYDRDSRALQKAVLAWTKKNYVWLHRYNPRIAEACLVDGMAYDAEHRRLVRTYPAEGLRRETDYVYLELDPAPPEPEPLVAAASS